MTHLRQDSILIVDDTPTNIKILFDALTHFGFKVSVAKSGESALIKAQEISPDLILLDVMMPGIDGFETCRRLKAETQTQSIPVIFMTALSEVKDKVKGLQLGAVDYITKPIQIEEVLARMDVHLTLKHTQTQLMHEISDRKQAELKLHHTLEELKQTQLQLVQNEKMSSLGQLVAGIAHEINNPVNFITGNLSHATDYVRDLLQLIELYQTSYPTPTAEIQAAIAAVDLEFLTQDLIKLFQSMQIGTERICEIIQSLRTFSRLDEAEFKTVDIHENIDSSLMILHHRLKAKPDQPAITVVRDFGSLPKVECYPGQLNQVFINILANAIDALEEQYLINGSNQDIAPLTVSIKTEQINENWIKIYVTDNGIGMDEIVQSKLFDPFFTTKLVGKGTGLGLSISYKIIVDKHKGYLTCQSDGRQGTVFTIEIPVTQNRE